MYTLISGSVAKNMTMNYPAVDLGFGSFPTAWRTIQGYEAMSMIRKSQVNQAEKQDVRAQNQFIAYIFGLAA